MWATLRGDCPAGKVYDSDGVGANQRRVDLHGSARTTGPRSLAGVLFVHAQNMGRVSGADEWKRSTRRLGAGRVSFG